MWQDLKDNLGFLTPGFGPPSMICSFLQWKSQDCIFFWHWAPSIPTDLCRRSTPYSSWDPAAHQTPPSPGNLLAHSSWGPWCTLRGAGQAVQRSWYSGHTIKHIKREMLLQPQSWRWWACAMWTTSLNTRSTSASCTTLFTDCSLLFFLTLLCWWFSGVHYCSPLPLFPWHSTFCPFWFLPFICTIFSLCLLCFPVVSQLVFLLPLLTLLRDSWGLSQSQSITFKEFRIKVLFPLASLLLLRSLFPCSVLCSVSPLKDGLLQYVRKEWGLEKENPKDLVNSLLNY